jgi:hypothetical protein
MTYYFRMLLIACAMSSLAVGCKGEADEPDDEKSTGDEVEEAADQAGDDIDEATEEAGDSVEDATD